MVFLVLFLIYIIPIIGLMCIQYQELDEGDTVGDLIDEIPAEGWIPVMNVLVFIVVLWIYVKEEWLDDLKIK